MSYDAFFSELEIFSHRILEAHGISKESPWGFDTLNAQGTIFHYTADTKWERVCRWFNEKRFESNVSAHVVVLRDKHPDHDKHADGLPEIKALPATVIQCRRPDQGAWHATWCNDTYYGIELLNVGELTQGDDGKFYDWRQIPFNGIVEKCFGRYWHPYTDEQLEAARIVSDYIGGNVLGHEQVQWNKSDPGPIFPFYYFREDKTFTDLEAYRTRKFIGNIALEAYETRMAITSPTSPTINEAWDDFTERYRENKPRDPLFWKTAFALLGYDPDLLSRKWEPADEETFKVFYRLLGTAPVPFLFKKHEPSFSTTALLRRLEDKRIVL